MSGSSVYFVYSAVTIGFMVFVTNHTTFCVLKCWHEHNKEKEDAVEESLESKAKNDEDSSEKGTIEKPESPESE